MTEPLVVSSEQLADYRILCEQLAWRYTGLHQAEFDDLFQEGWEKCFQALRVGTYPSKELVAKQMTRWVNRCANHWMGYEEDPLLHT